MTMTDADVVSELRREVAARLAEHAGDSALSTPRRADLVERYAGDALDALALRLLRDGRSPLSPADEARLARQVVDQLVGFGGLQELLDDPEVENVDCNGCDQVFVRYTDGQIVQVRPVAESDDELVALIRAFASSAGSGGGEERRFTRESPQLDLRLPDGSRLSAVMSVSKRPSISVRRPTLLDADLGDLVRRGSLDPSLAAVLDAAVRARLNIVIAGGTSTGKTTILRALARSIPSHERLITIEDAFELELDGDLRAHPNVVAMQSRLPNLEGEGGIGMASLVRGALRMNPDRVIVGEARGDEVIELLKAMSQGNDGSLATVHASSSAQAFTRLMMYAVQAPERLTFDASALLIAEAVDLVVHVDWTPDRRRVVSGLREVTGCDGRDVLSNEVWRPGPDRRATPATPLRVETLARLEACGLSPAAVDRIGW